MGKHLAVNVDCHNCREPSDRVVFDITIASPRAETLQVNGEFVDAVTLRIRGTLGFEDLRRELRDALSRFDVVQS
ncbi:MAG: hypothetical protein WBH85_04255 [Thermoanaerobaculia bacterium]